MGRMKIERQDRKSNATSGTDEKSGLALMQQSISFCSELNLSRGDAQVTEGWVTKVGRYLHLHSSRYLKLRGAALSSFHSPDRPATWTMNLLNCTVKPILKSKRFLISTPERGALEYSAFDETERDRWVAAIRKATTENIFSFYKIGPIIGNGSFSTVRLGASLDTRDIKKYAIKIIDKRRVGGNLKYMDREIAIMRSVRHKNIVQIYDIFETDKRLMIVLEYCPGGDLFEKLKVRSTLTETQAILVFRQLFSALEYLHSRGIVHRDIKPANFLLADSSESLQVKLSDFGLSNTMENASDVVMASIVGTPAFLPPEVIKNLPYGPKVDIWGMGISLYFLLSGRIPFDAKNRDQMFTRIQNDMLEFRGKVWENISFEAKDLLRKLLTKNPDKRLSALEALNHDWFNTKADLLEDLSEKNMLEIDSSDSAMSSVSRCESPAALTMLPNHSGSQSSISEIRRLSV